MQVFYGTPLPPGLVAPTQGELRLRIDQLLLEDDAINHNPLVHLFDTDAADTASTSDAKFVAAASRSPNRFVVPIDYCAVGPIFWGETRPTAQGQPSTPQLRRGPLTLAYPIKVDPRQFAAYLQRMTASPQGGVQLDVFVPSSYSGRPPVTVGKARLALDQLQPGRPIHGWLPVMHRRSRASLQQTDDSDASGAAAASSVREIPVGKVKVSVSIEYYPTTRHTVQQVPGKQHRHADVSGGGSGGGGGASLNTLPQAKTHRSARHPGRGGAEVAAYYPAGDGSTHSASSSSDVEGGRGDFVRLRGGERLRVHPRLSASTLSTQDFSSATHNLLEQGLRLRAQMDAAARGGLTDTALGLLGDKHSATHRMGSGADADDGLKKDEGHEDGQGAALPLNRSSGEAAKADAGDVDDDDSVYTSDASDEENFALQLQKDSEARDSRLTQQSTQVSQVLNGEVASSQPNRHSQSLLGSHLTVKSAASAAGTVPASVELSCSHFTFAQTETTKDLHQLRLSVRLSSDITTSEPTPGPLSSYVHPVPFQQPSICLHFDVCSYSEDRSKLVVEVYKVVEDVEVAEEEDGDAWEMRGPRHVAREELLGLSVVGLYRQSREVAFRDPVENCTNVFAQLELRLSPVAAADGAAGARLVPAVSPFASPASDGVLLSSIAGSSAPQPAKAAPERAPVKPKETSLSRPRTAEQDGKYDSSAVGQAPHAARAAQDFSLSNAAAAAASPPSPSPANASLVATERRRLRLVVHRAVELPRVAVAQQQGSGGGGARPSSRFPLVSSSPRLLPDAGVDGAHRYTEPSSFVTVEEIFQSTQAALFGQEKGVEEMPKSRACMQAVANWYVDEARSGYYDRSVVAEQTCNPHYDYEVLLQLPEMKTQVTAEDASTLTVAKSITSVNDTTTTTHRRGGATAEALEEVQLNVWHSDPARRGDPPAAAAAGGGGQGTVRAKAREHEENFWTCAAYMGTCRVDLRPLRYLPLIHGYYRVVCERTPHNATDETAADTDANTIGYMRVSISLL